MVPEDLKIAIVTPLFKKGEKHERGNCKPVSMTAAVDKILTSIIKDEVSEHLEAHGKIR